MNIKFLSIALLLCCSSSAFADAIYGMQNYSKRSAIQSTSAKPIIINVSEQKNSGAYSKAIEELKIKIASEPSNYILYVNLIDLYINSGMFDPAFQELMNLAALNDKKLLSSNVFISLKKLNNNIKSQVRYSVASSNYLICSSIINIILNDYKTAEKCLNIVISKPNISHHLIESINFVYNKTKNYSEAVSCLDEILKKNPSDINAKKSRAFYLIKLNKNKGALNDFSEILFQNPDDQQVFYEIYKILKSQKKSEKEFVNYFVKNLKFTEEQTFDSLSSILLNNEDYSSAEFYAQKLIKKYPDNANGYIVLSEIYRKQGKLKESYEILQKVKDKADDKNSIAKYNVLSAKLSEQPVKEAVTLMNNALYSQALEVLDSADPDNLYVILNKSVCYYYLNNKQKALELANTAMSFYPKNPDVFYNFAFLFFNENDLESSRNYLNSALKINPSHKKALILQDSINKAEADKLIDQILACLDSQNYNEAMRLINKALSINSKDSFLYLYKGITYIAQSNYAASTAMLYKAIDLDKSNFLAYYYLAVAFDNLSEFSNALENYKIFVNKLPKDAYQESEKYEYAKLRIEKLSAK